MKSALYNQKGEKVGEVDLPEDVLSKKLIQIIFIRQFVL